ncbi:cadherin-18-like protein, partial [Lates japonicus]
MRVPATLAAVSCLCPLVVILCVVSQSCYGTRVNLSPHANPNPSLYPNPRLKSLPEATPNPSKSPDKHKTPLRSSQLLSSSQNLWTKFQLKPRLDTMSYLTENHRSNTNFPSAISPAATSSNIKLNNPKQSSKINPITNPKPILGSLWQPKPEAVHNSKISNPSSRTSIRAQRNQTKLLDTDKDSHHRPKRGWIWNQFFVLEEHIGPEPQYVGK